MDDSPSPTALDGLHTLAGRLLFAFQELEHVLKRLPCLIRSEGWASEFQETLAKRQDVLSTTTLGGVITVLEAAMEPPSIDDLDVVTGNDAHVSYHVSFGNRLNESTIEQLRSLANERNWLIHHCLKDYRIDDSILCGKLVARLETLLAQVEERVRQLHGIEKLLLGAMGAMLQVEQQLQIFDPNTWTVQIVAQKLEEVANEHGDQDGWAPVGLAANFLKTEMRDQCRDAKQSLGARTLSKLITKFGFFELRPGAPGVEALYRKKPVDASLPQSVGPNHPLG